MRTRLTLGAWLCAAPLLFAQSGTSGADILTFALDETPEQVTRLLGKPVQVADAGPAYFSWSYQKDVSDLHEHSHLLMFRKSDNRLVSVTRNFHAPTSVDALFPKNSSKTYSWPNEKEPQWQVRVWHLSGQRIGIAMGVAQSGDTTTQVLLIRRSALPAFLPWLAEQVLK